MKTRKVMTRCLWIALLGLLGLAVYAWRSEIPPVDPPDPTRFGDEAIRRGAVLAAIGACATCHTTAGGEAFAGGRPFSTPFGTVFSTNITPDPASGIGHWSLEAFERAMREGVDRSGTHLYPTFPYDHFTLVSDADCAALYAFMMTRQPVESRTPDNDVSFPFSLRFTLAGWKLLFLRKGPYEADTGHAAQWNRGAYLANGIGHCGACHTPRNSLGAEINGRHFAGGAAEGWYSYAINSGSRAQESWNADSLHFFLKNGWHEQHGAAQGPMAAVTQNLSAIPDSDLRAISAYMADVMHRPEGSPKKAFKQDKPGNDIGAAIYASACENCHDGTRPLPYGGIRLPLSTAVTGETATNLINVVLQGMQPPAGTAGAIMPGFSSTLTDGQLESLVAYIRANFSSKAPWTGVESRVRDARSRIRD